MLSHSVSGTKEAYLLLELPFNTVMGVHPGKLGKKKIQKKHRLQKLN
jgi:hypothetical protein